MPRSLLGRMLLLTLLAVLLAQALSSVIWVTQLRATQLEGLVTSARSLAHSMVASVSCRSPIGRWYWNSCAAWAARVSS
jgi:hypothetical protein